jgi:hypothetical protein
MINYLKDHKLISILFVSILFLSVWALVYTKSEKKNYTNKVFSTDSFESLTDQGDWQLGSFNSSNLDIVTTPGIMQLGQETEITFNDSAITANLNIVDKNKINDSNVSTYWESWIYGIGEEAWIKVDLGAVYSVSKIRIHAIAGAGVVEIQSSPDDLTYTSFDSAAPGAAWDSRIYSPAEETRYVRFYVENITGAPMEATVAEVEFYQKPNSATHTTAPTQIDGQEGSADKTLIEWETFTPTQTVPANTLIEYQFRTSANGVDGWTDWSVAQEYSGTPLDLTGLTANRYLQVEATLTNSDGVSTPQIDDYTIDFHNNQKPNQPTAQTAVIGD